MKIIDIHIYLGKWHAPLEDINARQTLAVMDANSIQYGIAMGSEAIAYDFVEANAWVASQVETEGKDRLFGHVQVNGHYVEESLAELDKHLTKPSFLGVKIHPSYSQIAITHPNFEPILSRIQQIGKPVLLHTSGTAARPKQVPLTHGNLVGAATRVVDSVRLGAKDRCLNVMPLFHIHGLIGALLSTIFAGASIVCTPGFYTPKFFAGRR